ncbi:hypothetical protein H8356DRAFT_1039750 [Neocallimastix lanati (nom. inval.)]|uniref:Mid2 domain-containing protein n=1 Tax=Neocallimastix californiae TaxID=1754190 RepID=A0A1Y2ANQ2_9FUNG|nr:hypothetical protein H8356DRAFT_1039750 [Neocallimastix sp. JGI-2020a]ORY23585.1 hypothetical protein LY90DRAFT_514973 [Neocallimastix californiae]|eukprot:ORY23585.1 hypothetical protein LY90DRAFT_514973 [Neocallimastix californiae]
MRNILLIFSIILLYNLVCGHTTNYEADLDNVLDQLSKFENSLNGKNVKNSTAILSTDKSATEENNNNGSLNIILPAAIGGVVLATLSASVVTYFVLKKKKNTQLYAGAYAGSSTTSLNNLPRSKKPSYEDLVSIGCEF